MIAKKTIAIVTVSALLLFVAGVLVFMSTRSGNRGAVNRNGDLPGYALSRDEERRVSEFVQLFISLYNTYSQADLSNLSALGDYQTPFMQESTAILIENLETQLPEGYEKSTSADVATFKYDYPEARRIIATMQAAVTETGMGEYNAEALVTLERFGDRWLVNNFSINKK